MTETTDQTNLSNNISTQSNTGKVGKTHNKAVIFTILGVLLLVVIGAFIYLSTNLLGKVGFHLVFKSNTNAVIKAAKNDNVNLNQASARDILMNRWLYQETGKSMGITVSDQQALDAAKLQLSNNSDVNVEAIKLDDSTLNYAS